MVIKPCGWFPLLAIAIGASSVLCAAAAEQAAGSESRLVFTLAGPAMVQIVDPLGHSVWAQEDGYASDIPGISIFPDFTLAALGARHAMSVVDLLEIDAPPTGDYLVEVIGSSPGEFGLTISAHDGPNDLRSRTELGKIGPDQVVPYRLSYTCSPDTLRLEALDPEAHRALSARFPGEINPCRETVLISAAWGPGEDQISEPPYWEGARPIVRGPGPFAVDERGSIYILDGPRRELKRYTPQGVWAGTIRIPVPESTGFERANDASVTTKGNVTFRFSGGHGTHEAGGTAGPPPISTSDLAVANGVAVWREERFVRFLDLHAPDTLVCRRYWDLRPDPETDISYEFEIVRTGDDVRLHDLQRQRSMVIVEGGRILRFGPYHIEPGLEVYPGLRLARLPDPRRFGDHSSDGVIELPGGGRALPGDVVRLAPDGSVLDVFAEQSGRPMGCDSAGRVLLHKRLRGENIDIYSSEGALLSRTRMPIRRHTGAIKLGPRHRMGERCFYEIWIEREGLRVSRWDMP